MRGHIKRYLYLAILVSILSANVKQEVSQMLAGHLTNQDEDEVEDELEALRLEAAGPEVLPDPVVLPSPPTAKPERVQEPEPEPERAEPRTERREALPA